MMPQPPDTRRCPDCAAPVDRRGIEHEPSCPVWLDLVAASERDRQWFESHPGADRYWRAYGWGELVELCTLYGARGLAGRRFEVRQIEPGVRARLYGLAR